MVNINELKQPEIISRLEQHEKIGGALRISVFGITENYEGKIPGEYTAHMVCARQTLEKENYMANSHFNKLAPKNKRHGIPIAQTDYNKLDASGKKLSLEQFLGPHYDLEKNKPLVRGQAGNETFNAYFYYDDIEVPAHTVDINSRAAKHKKMFPDADGGFIHVMMEPPYNINLDIFSTSWIFSLVI